jgi:hypothetical protein
VNACRDQVAHRELDSLLPEQRSEVEDFVDFLRVIDTLLAQQGR